MTRPYQVIRIFSVQDRRRNKPTKPWVTRWQVDGRHRSRSFRTRAEAERYRSLLLHALHTGEQFDDVTGEPAAWGPGPGELSTYEWARRWLAEQWDEWQPRTRRSAVESLSRFVIHTASGAGSPPPNGLRPYLERALAPGFGDRVDGHEMWLTRSSPPLRQLTRGLLAEVDRRLGLGDRDQPLAPSTAARYRKPARACLRRAVTLDLLREDPWPPSPKGRARRKAVRTRRPLDLRRLPDPETMAAAIAAIPTHQPGSGMYQVMTAVAYYGGLRPSEVVMLRRRSLDLPNGEGWGHIHVTEADIGGDQPGEPKTGIRTVPIPPVLVAHLHTWLDRHQLAPDDLLFRTRTGRQPTPSNWSRAWHRALGAVGHPPLRVYDCRHAAATTWLQAGVPLGEVARRLGHSVDTLVTTYIGALNGDQRVANGRIEAILAGSSSSI